MPCLENKERDIYWKEERGYLCGAQALKGKAPLAPYYAVLTHYACPPKAEECPLLVMEQHGKTKNKEEKEAGSIQAGKCRYAAGASTAKSADAAA